MRNREVTFFQNVSVLKPGRNATRTSYWISLSAFWWDIERRIDIREFAKSLMCLPDTGCHQIRRFAHCGCVSVFATLTHVKVVLWMLYHYTVLADRLTTWWKSTPVLRCAARVRDLTTIAVAVECYLLKLFIYMWYSWLCNQFKTINNLVKHLRLK
jgi:hypothetical protein